MSFQVRLNSFFLFFLIIFISHSPPPPSLSLSLQPSPVVATILYHSMPQFSKHLPILSPLSHSYSMEIPREGFDGQYLGYNAVYASPCYQVCEFIWCSIHISQTNPNIAMCGNLRNIVNIFVLFFFLFVLMNIWIV